MKSTNIMSHVPYEKMQKLPLEQYYSIKELNSRVVGSVLEWMEQDNWNIADYYCRNAPPDLFDIWGVGMH